MVIVMMVNEAHFLPYVKPMIYNTYPQCSPTRLAFTHDLFLLHTTTTGISHQSCIFTIPFNARFICLHFSSLRMQRQKNAVSGNAMGRKEVIASHTGPMAY